MSDDAAKRVMPHAGDQPRQRHIAVARIVGEGGVVDAAGLFLSARRGKESGKSVNGAGTSGLLRALFWSNN